MRTYSTRERILFFVGLVLCLALVAGVIMIMATQPGAAKDLWLWVAGAGALGGSYICLKVIVTGRATAHLERDVRDVFGLR